jgi:uncharacterized surface protein with fasciclin (FAS1) repeats
MLNLHRSKSITTTLTLIGLVLLTPLLGVFANTDTDCSESRIAKNSTTKMVCPYAVASGNLVEIAQNEGVFSTLIMALKATGLDQTLASKTTKFTVFAPTDEAFSKLPTGTVENLLLPENKAKLTQILTYHIIMEPMTATDIQKNNLIRTVEGDTLKASTIDGKPFINDAQITSSNIYATNGIIHVIDTVLMPSD